MKAGSMLLLIGALLFNGSINAQSSSGQFSLVEAITYAKEHNVDLQNENLDIQKAAFEIKEVVRTGFPQINGEINYQNFPSIPTQLIPAEFFGGQAGEFAEVQFGTRHNMKAGITGTQLLFSSSYLQGLKATSKYKALAATEYRKTERDVELNVRQAYYTALVNSEAVHVLKENKELLAEVRDETTALYDVGFVEQIEVDRLNISVLSLETQIQNAERQGQLAYTLLKYQMGYPLEDTLVLTDSLTMFREEGDQLLLRSFDHTNRVEYELLDIQQQLQEIQIAYTRSGYFPTISLFGSYEQNAQRNEFNFLSGDEPWFETVVWGVNVQIPIFDGFARSATIQKEKITLQQVSNYKERLKEQLGLEVAQARTNYLNAVNILLTQQKNIELAQRIFKTTVIKYDEGVGNSLEVNDAQRTLTQTQNEYIRALYDALIAKVNLEKALGLL